MSEQIYELISHFDLRSLKDLPRIFDWGSKTVEDLHLALWERIYATQYDELPSKEGIDQFRFLASASLRGDICPGCRSEKIESLGRFAALYSDETIVPLPLSRPGNYTSQEHVRADILKTVESLIRLRPLIRSGIAIPAVMSTVAYCEHDAAATQELIQLASLYAGELADEHFHQFEMLYEPGSDNGISPKLYIRGPEDYIEHGQVVIWFSKPPQWIAKSWRPGPDGLLRVPTRKARKTGIVHELFQRIASDTTFQMAYGIPRRAKLLTDLPGDTELLRGLDQEDIEIQNQRAILFNALSHALPFTSELTILQTVRLRKELRGAFEQYRFAISSIVRSHERDHDLTHRRAKQIFNDELLPKIVALENQLEAERKRFGKKVAITAGVMSVVVGLGLFGILSPSMALGLLGGAATMKLADQIGDAASPLPQAVSNDLYFLLKLKQRGRSRSK